MRIALLVNRDLHATVALNRLAPTLARHHVHVFCTDRVGHAPPAVPHLSRLRQLEQVIPLQGLFPAIESLGRPHEQQWLTLRQLAAGWDGFDTLNAPNSADGVAALARFSPDLIVSIRFGARLRGEAIAVPRLGVLNLHSGLLPAYRGVLATLRALLAGDRVIGCTLHWITDADIDTGGIVATSATPVHDGSSLFDAIQSVYPGGCARLAEAIRALDAGAVLPSMPQREGGAYYSWPGVAEFAAAEAMGHRVVEMESYERLLGCFLPRGVPLSSLLALES